MPAQAMTANSEAPYQDGRRDLECQFLATVLGRGAPGFAEIVGTPFDPDWIADGDVRIAYQAATEIARRGMIVGPIAPDLIGDEVRTLAPNAAERVQGVAEIAVEAWGGEASPGVIGALVGDLADLREEEKQAAAGQRKPTTRLLSAADIFAPLPSVPWLCQALDLAPGAPALVAGYGFSGKTLAVQDLALAVATGSLLWGRFPVRQGRVLHLDYEQGSYLTRQRYQRLALARGVHPADLEGRLSLACLPPWYLDGDAADTLTRLCEGFDLTIVDSFRAACPSTDENSSEARVPLDRLGRISETTGAVFGVIHHARKPSRDAQGGARMSVRGSGALYDACGSVLVFSAAKGDPTTVAHEKARISGRPHEDFRLMVEDVEIDGDPAAGLRVVCLDAPNSVKAPDRHAETKARVLELIREDGTFSGGVNLLRSRLGAKKDDVRAAVADLEEEGAIHRGGSYHHPTYRYVGTDSDQE